MTERRECMGSQIGKVLLLIVLAGASYEDCKEKQISLYLLMGAAVTGIALHLLCWEKSLTDILFGAAVGLMVLLLSWASRGSVGAGDGIMLMVSGIFLGFWENVVLLMMALLLVSMAALFLIVVKKKARNYRLPFLPFLLAAYLFGLL